VATFLSGIVQTAKNGVIMRDNRYGKLEKDVVRRDFNINALYIDVNKQEVIVRLPCLWTKTSELW
jgi:poly(A) polymerase